MLPDCKTAARYPRTNDGAYRVPVSVKILLPREAKEGFGSSALCDTSLSESELNRREPEFTLPALPKGSSGATSYSGGRRQWGK